MPEEFIKHLIHWFGHRSRKAREEGDKKTANGLALIAFGILFLPIPFIGLPLLLMGIWKMLK